jgi:hypothetical protein
VGTLFLSVISREPRETIFYSELVANKNRLSVETRAIEYGLPRFPRIYLLEMKFPLEYIHSEPYF